jgi:CrcB protein
MDLLTVAAVAAGGALGTVARYLLALALAPISGTLPWGTVVINVTGAFVIGLFGTLTLAHGRYPAPSAARPSTSRPRWRCASPRWRSATSPVRR